MRRIERRRKVVVTGAVLAALAAFVVVSSLEAASTRTAEDEWVEGAALLVIEDIGEAVDAVLADLESVAALLEHANPTRETFNRFVEQIDGTAHALGIGYTHIVPADSIDDYIAEQRDRYGADYEIFALDDNTSPIAVDRAGRSVFYPVEYFAVGEVLAPLAAAQADPTYGLGMDAGFNPDWRAESAIAAAADGPVLSKFISIKIDVIQVDRVFFATVPVRDPNGSTGGLLQALMLEQLLLPDEEGDRSSMVDWEVIPAGGTPTRIDPEAAHIFPLELPGITWSLAVAPTDAALAELHGLPWWVPGIVTSLVVLLASMALWLFVDRRAEHRRVAQYEQVAADKDRFLASVSHELRTPLTVVAGLAYELRKDDFTTEERTGLMDMMVEQTDELSGIVEDLLVAARSDIGMVAIHHSHVDIGTEAGRAMEVAGVGGETRGIPTPAFADPQRVRQILRNLLINAKRYGGPKVRIGFAAGAGWTEVVVSDNGAGVAPNKREAIFQSYESAHKPTAVVRSVGLGLYISRTLARAMGGDLEYVYDGEWSHFRLRLPAADIPSEPRSPEPAGSQSTTA